MPSVEKTSSFSTRKTRPYTGKYNLRSTAKIFPFLDLPGEIRNQIYEEVAATKDFALFSTSKQVHEEGLPRAFRIYFNYDEEYHPEPRYPTYKIKATPLIQDLIIQLNYSDDKAGNYIDPAEFEYFGVNNIIRELCVVVFDCNEPGDIVRNHYEWDIRALGTLTNFKRLGVKLTYSEPWVLDGDAEEEIAKDFELIFEELMLYSSRESLYVA